MSDLKQQILDLVRRHAHQTHAALRPPVDGKSAVPFVPGQTTVPYAGRVFSEDEVVAAVSSTLDFWLTLGKEGDAFSAELAKFLGVKKSLLVNSGSSANLIAVHTLTSFKITDDKRLKPGDEVITCAAGFPTTVAPIIQAGAVPVFIDNDPVTGNADVRMLEEAFVPGKTKAVMFAHTLGNPFDIGSVLAFCRKHDLFLIEDNCDALGCTYSMPIVQIEGLKLARGQKEANLTPGTDRMTLNAGNWGDLSTQSFYPPHHLTMGEGGAVNIVSREILATIAESFRDWGRDCWCPSGCDNTCGKRFDWRMGELPHGYDHKYVYSHLGFNVKPLDPQAAIGREQLKKLPAFVEARKRNWDYLRRGMADLGEFFDFTLPTHATGWTPEGFTWDGSGRRTDCSWFGFMLRVKPTAPFTRRDLVKHLDERKIGNRMLFGGNLVRQPAFVDLKRERPGSFRVIGDLRGADAIMNEAVFVGTYPGLTDAMLAYMVETVRDFVKQGKK